MTQQPRFVIVMGVSGSGKTTVASALAERLGWIYAEGDDFHPEVNVEKMTRGDALNDADRWPWLRSVRDWMDERERAGTSAVITCSALKRTYRDLLRQGREGVQFCEIGVSEDELKKRLAERKGHYMPASLLSSQLAALEPLQEDEPGVRVQAGATPAEVVTEALIQLGLGSAG